MILLSSRNVLISILACGAVAAVVLACGKDGSNFDDGSNQVGTFNDGGGFGDSDNTGVDLYKNDPFPKYCGPDAGGAPPPIQGTEECPEDKNKPGCGCDKPGEEGACWTGLRKHRNLGICHDGKAKCIVKNETLNVWGACEGEQLPIPQSNGKNACTCFSLGTWKIANQAPCLRTPGDGTYYAYSTVQGADGNPSFCDNINYIATPGVAPTGVWSSNTLTVDCAGKFRLCFRVRAGDIKNPLPTDCILGESCIDAQYDVAKVEQKMPDLPVWAGKDQACAKKWEGDTPGNVSPGYGEMLVKGTSVQCDEIGGEDFVFNRVQYCPRICRPSDPAYNPNDPLCISCQTSGQGTF